MEALGIDVKLIVVQAANFLILLYLLKRFMYQPILNMLNKRAEDSQAILDEKNELSEKIENIDKEREEVLKQTRTEADEIISQARGKGERLAQQVEGEAKEKAAQIVKQGQESVALKERELREKLRNEVAAIAVDTAETVVGKSIDEGSKKEITDESIRRFVNDGR